MSKLKKSFQIIFVIPFILFALLTPSHIFAQDENVIDQAPVINDVPSLRAEFKQYTQDPTSKEAKFEIVLKSNLDSDRVQISWTLTTLSGSGAVFKDKALAKSFINIKKGQNYNKSIVIIPSGKGEIELLGKIESFKAGETFVVTVKKIFATNIQGEILPLTQDYIADRRGVLIRNIIIFIVAVIAFVYLLKKGIVLFKKWLKK